jgi:hypothetical protein
MHDRSHGVPSDKVRDDHSKEETFKLHLNIKKKLAVTSWRKNIWGKAKKGERNEYAPVCQMNSASQIFRHGCCLLSPKACFLTAS